MRKVVKIVTFYDDGTFSESVPTQEPIVPLPYPPFKPLGPTDWPLPQSPTPNWYGNCPQCGMKLDSVMGYVCSNAKCPTGLGGTWCHANE